LLFSCFILVRTTYLVRNIVVNNRAKAIKKAFIF
jgi:hypothetical protein